MKIKFQKAVSQNRKKLRQAGFTPATIHNWEYGKKRPKFDNAVKLSFILGMDLRDIPYWRVEINTP